jgi:hypothetical protein
MENVGIPRLHMSISNILRPFGLHISGPIGTF